MMNYWIKLLIFKRTFQMVLVEEPFQYTLGAIWDTRGDKNSLITFHLDGQPSTINLSDMQSNRYCLRFCLFVCVFPNVFHRWVTLSCYETNLFGNRCLKKQGLKTYSCEWVVFRWSLSSSSSSSPSFILWKSFWPSVPPKLWSVTWVIEWVSDQWL